MMSATKGLTQNTAEGATERAWKRREWRKEKARAGRARGPRSLPAHGHSGECPHVSFPHRVTWSQSRLGPGTGSIPFHQPVSGRHVS